VDLLFLGTSAGVPTKKRNVTGLALQEETGRDWFLVDCGEATQHQVLHTRLSLNDLQGIFITHVHGDHCYGLPGLLASAGMSGRKKPLRLIAPAGIAEWLKATQYLTQFYLPFDLEFLPTESLGSWSFAHWMVEATSLSHRVPSFAYRFTETHREASLDTDKLLAEGVPRGPLWGELHKGQDVVHEGRTLRHSDYLIYPYPPRCIVVAGDNDRPALLREFCEQSHLLVHESTYTQEVADKAGDTFGHSSAASIAGFAQAVGLPNLILTHFSARYQTNPEQTPSIEDIRIEAMTHYQGTLFLAEDFARYRLAKNGALSQVIRQ
jgi:ribonuclease Z